MIEAVEKTEEGESMQYCAKCRAICQDSDLRCPSCKSQKLRPAADGDMVLLHRADQYTAGKLQERFEAAGILCEAEPFGKGRVSYLYDGEVMPTDKNIYVRFSDLDAAREISAGIQAELEREQSAEDGEFEDMPRKKRIFVQSVSVIAFLLLVMAAVFGADALANWLKGLLGM